MRSGFFFVREAAPSQLTPSDHTGKGENPERGVAELQTGVGTVLRNKGIWLSNREDVVVGHYTPLTPPRKTNPRRRLSHGEAFYSAWLRLVQTRG
jgi:hypothetical protein